jgi:hypothetical protein
MAEGFKVWATNDVLSATDLNDYTVSQSVMRFANAAARDAALTSGVVKEGMLAWTKDNNTLWANTDSTTTGWVQIWPITNSGITNAMLATDSVTNTKIAAGAVTNAKIGASAVGNSQLGSAAVSPAKVAAGTYSIDISGNAGSVDGYSASISNTSSRVVVRSSGGQVFVGDISCGDVSASGVVFAVGFVTTSTRDVKEQIQDLPLEKAKSILDVRPVTYVSKGTDGPVQAGVIAEELAALGLTELVYYDNGKPKAVHYDRLAVHLLGVVKDLSARVAVLEGSN